MNDKLKKIAELTKDPELTIYKEVEKVGEKVDTSTKEISNTILSVGQEIVKAVGCVPAPKDITPSLEAIHNEIVELKKKESATSFSLSPQLKKELKGEKGDSYKLTEQDKKEIALSIDVPIVEKVVEKTETIKEVVSQETGKTIIEKINKDDTSTIKKEKVEGLAEIERIANFGANRPIGVGGGASGIRDIRAGGGISVSKVNEVYTISNISTDTDEKVKLSALDPTAGYLNDKLSAGTGINYNNGVISNTGVIAETDPVWLADKPNYLTSATATSTYVPYTGATTTVNLGSQALTTTGNISGKNITASSATYPPLNCIRTSTGTSTNLAAAAVTQETTGDMVDGFGTAFAFNIKDSAGVTNVIGAMGAIRDGADNTGALVFDTRILNSQSTKMKIFGAGTLRILNAGSATNYADFTVDTNGDLSITANGGDISFGNENILTTGTLGAGATTVSSLTNSALTSGRIPYASTAGLLADSANLSYVSTNQNLKLTGGLKIRGKAQFQATGTVSYVNTSKVVNGSGTAFLTEVKVGDYVWNKSSYATAELASAANALTRVDSVVSDTQLTTRDNSFQPSGSGLNMGVAPCLLNMTDYNDANATISGDTAPGFNGIYVDYFMNMYPAGNVVLANLKTLNFTGNGVIQSTSSGSNIRMRATEGTNSVDFVVVPNTYEFQVNPSQINAPTLLKGGWNNAGANAYLYPFIISGGDAGDTSNRNANSLVLRGGNNRGNVTAGGLVKIQSGKQLGSTNTLQTYYDRAIYNIGLSAGGEGFVGNEDGEDYDHRWEGDTDTNLLQLDASTDRVGIGTSTPTTKLDVNGTVNATAFSVGGTGAVADGTYSFYNDGVTPGQVTSITTKSGIITAITVLP